jgi:hypothetical protein
VLLVERDGDRRAVGAGGAKLVAECFGYQRLRAIGKTGHLGRREKAHRAVAGPRQPRIRSAKKEGRRVDLPIGQGAGHPRRIVRCGEDLADQTGCVEDRGVRGTPHHAGLIAIPVQGDESGR